MPRSIAEFDVSDLSPRALETLELIARPLADGHDIRQLADELGVPISVLRQRLEQLAAEWTNLGAGVELPKLTAAEYRALRDSIAAHGQLYPILVDREGRVIDGNNRLRACRELGIEPIYRVVELDLTDDQRKSLALVANVARRHLPASAKRGYALAELMRNPTRSDRLIADSVGVSHTLVGTLRRQLEDEGALATVANRTDRRGEQRDWSSRRQPQPPVESGQVAVTGSLTLVVCPECGHRFDPDGKE